MAALADFVWSYEGHYFIYRSAALKASNELTKKQPLPLERVGSVTEISIDRLRDMAVLVCRCAMHSWVCMQVS